MKTAIATLGACLALALLFSCSDSTTAGDSGADLDRDDQGTADTGNTDQGNTDQGNADQGNADNGNADNGSADAPGQQDKGSSDAKPGDCAKMDAKAVGLCDMILGVAWNGIKCVSLTGCSCQGADCATLFKTPTACEKKNQSCICAPMDAKGVGGCKMIIGVVWNGKSCVPISGCSCQGTDCFRLYKVGNGLIQCQKEHSICP